MKIRFVDSDNAFFNLEQCKYEIKIRVERMHSQIIPLKHFREIDEYCTSIGRNLDFDSLHDNTMTCTVA